MVLVYKSHYFSPPYRVQILSQLLRKLHTKLMRSNGIHVDRDAEIGGVVASINFHRLNHEPFTPSNRFILLFHLYRIRFTPLQPYS